MIISARVQISSLVNTILIYQQEEMNVAEGNPCSCFLPTWKPASNAMVAKMSQTTSWVPMHSMPWPQCKRWTPIGLMQ
jgi:hypothetical protein